jgi:hypothetical protein
MLWLFDRPKIRFGDYMSLNDDPESVEPKLILKRASKDTTSMDKVNSYLGATMEPEDCDLAHPRALHAGIK